MSVIHNDLLLATDEATGYNLTKSLRFRGAASGALTRTPATTGNQRTFTWSGWVKRGSLGTNTLFDAFYGGSTRYDLLYFNSSDNIRFFGGVYSTGASTTTSVDLVTTQVFRDPSAWYHIVLAVDTTQATAANRVKLYVNGSQVTSFSTSTYPAQNDQTYYNVTTTGMSIGSDTGNSFTFDGYMADVYSVDGQALTPSSFGETDTITGVWKPKAYTGTYGTNGFYLPFTDVATTSGSNAGLGKDFSGNGNYWTTNNISVTAGSTYDSMTDVPTLTSATAANYAVLNPLRPNGSASLVNGNLGVTPSGTYCNGLSTIQLDSGSYYAECTVTTAQAMGWGIWLNSASTTANVGTTPTGFYGIYSGGATLMINGTTPYTNAGASPSNGDIVQVAWSNGKVWFGKNNTWYDSTFGTTGNPSAGTNATVSSLSNNAFSIAFCGANASPVLAANFGQQPFAYTPPSGYVALNTYNLPDSTIVAGNTVMDATTWTGDGNNPRSITNTAGFKPDLVWSKLRSGTASNNLYDSVRGTGKVLYSDLTSAEDTNNPFGYLTAFNSNGFSSTAGSTSNAYFNANGSTYVAWQWQAGQGTTSSNTAGSITSTVSVNATAGFSIVTYTSPSGGATAYTVGHGLGVAPSLVISKERNVSGIWSVYHASTGATRLQLQDTGTGTTNVWTTLPTSTTFWQGVSYSDGSQRVAYCWSEIAGFSKFGSYTGNGSTDGPFIYTGFRPRYIMVKRTDSTGAWEIYDTSRSLYNVAGPKDLQADSSGAENASTITNGYDFLSNGFKTRDTTSYLNTSGATYIYAAFAENPFKNSLAR